ncbi:hypothetical protein H0H92_006242 [Tricholoma furcatifolium]|nr:hypothetical protein H0H92_006242 [Tricholoma furcatifolium]
MTAILCKDFMDEAVQCPTDAEKEEAKVWVANHSCKAWRDGWCLVDGTLEASLLVERSGEQLLESRFIIKVNLF